MLKIKKLLLAAALIFLNTDAYAMTLVEEEKSTFSHPFTLPEAKRDIVAPLTKLGALTAIRYIINNRSVGEALVQGLNWATKNSLAKPLNTLLKYAYDTNVNFNGHFIQGDSFVKIRYGIWYAVDTLLLAYQVLNGYESLNLLIKKNSAYSPSRLVKKLAFGDAIEGEEAVKKAVEQWTQGPDFQSKMESILTKILLEQMKQMQQMMGQMPEGMEEMTFHQQGGQYPTYSFNQEESSDQEGTVNQEETVNQEDPD